MENYCTCKLMFWRIYIYTVHLDNFDNTIMVILNVHGEVKVSGLSLLHFNNHWLSASVSYLTTLPPLVKLLECIFTSVNIQLLFILKPRKLYYVESIKELFLLSLSDTHNDIHCCVRERGQLVISSYSAPK